MSKDKLQKNVTETKSNNDNCHRLVRRAVLKGAITSSVIAGGISIPDKWSKPVVNAVMLPAHAQTTSVEGGTIILVVTLSGNASGDVVLQGVFNNTIDVPADLPEQIEINVDAGQHFLNILISSSLQPEDFSNPINLDDGASSVPSTFTTNNSRDYDIIYNVEPGETVTCTLVVEDD